MANRIKHSKKGNNGKFYYMSAKGPDEKAFVLDKYYESHTKRVNNAINAYKERNGIITNKSNKQIFIDELKNTARDWGSRRQAKYEIEKKLVSYHGGDTDWYEAKHGYGSKEFGDLRRLNKYQPEKTEYEYEIEPDVNVIEYYTLPNSDFVIANIRYTNDGRSPTYHWEYKRRDEVGL